ncbi:hypothetical protein M1534_00105 [Patescibacteria group bacterium]|jgi:Na+/phosphate symporter|nr:hypothetical protein [Patescibacteria group bacterium]
MLKNLKKEMKFLGNCPLCKGEYDPESVALLEQDGVLSLYHATCTSCNSMVILVVMKNLMNFVTTIGMITDLNKDEFPTFFAKDAVNYDEVLAVHQALKSINQ